MDANTVSLELSARRSPAPAYAALDLGTNNCRLLVGTPTSDGFRVLDSFSRIVRLGEGLHHTGQLSKAAMDRAIAALHGCAARLARRDVRVVRAIATEACRRAGNGAEFLARVKAETGIRFEIIAPREEAELALESCAPLLGGTPGRALLFDIGGGSTELAWVRTNQGSVQPELVGYISLPVGVVTLAERFGAAGFEPEGFAAMVDDVVQRLVPFERVHRISQEIRQCSASPSASMPNVRLLGTSGTVTTLAGIVLELKQYSRPAVDGLVLSRQNATAALDSLRAMGREGLVAHPCVGPERADFVLPGCAIFAAIQSLWPADQVMVADRGLREGVLLRLIRADRAKLRADTRAHAQRANMPQPGADESRVLAPVVRA